MTETDELLMLAVRDGDLAKLGVLFDRHHRALFDFFVRMTASRTLAEDLVQDVFFRILKYRETFRDESRFKAWMYQIARNARFDHHKKRDSETELPPEVENELPSRASFPGHDLKHEPQKVHRGRAFDRLPVEKGEVLILSRYQEMKYEQSAEVMGCEVGAVKVRVHRALKELRDIFMKLSSQRPPCNVKKSDNSLRIM